MSKKKSKYVLDADEVRKLTSEEVGVELKRLRGELYALRVQSVTGKVEDSSAFSKTKRSIARLMTERNVRHKAQLAKDQPAKAGKAPSKSASR